VRSRSVGFEPENTEAMKQVDIERVMRLGQHVWQVLYRKKQSAFAGLYRLYNHC